MTEIDVIVSIFDIAVFEIKVAKKSVRDRRRYDSCSSADRKHDKTCFTVHSDSKTS